MPKRSQVRNRVFVNYIDPIVEKKIRDLGGVRIAWFWKKNHLAATFAFEDERSAASAKLELQGKTYGGQRLAVNPFWVENPSDWECLYCTAESFKWQKNCFACE